MIRGVGRLGDGGVSCGIGIYIMDLWMEVMYLEEEWIMDCDNDEFFFGVVLVDFYSFYIGVVVGEVRSCVEE